MVERVRQVDLLGCRDVKQCLFAPPGIAIPGFDMD